jgi:hypothetical protein
VYYVVDWGDDFGVVENNPEDLRVELVTTDRDEADRMVVTLSQGEEASDGEATS